MSQPAGAESTRAIAADLVWTGADFGPSLAVLVAGDSIQGVVDRSQVPDSVPIEEWGHTAIVPGTVNAHGHSFQNLLKGFADDRPFESWRDDVLYPFSERVDGEAIYTGALFAFAEALLAGVTTTVDFFYLNDESNANAEQVIRAARDVGIRLVLARAFYDVDAPTRAPARYREDAEEAAARCVELAAAHSRDALVSVQPAPHSLHAASPKTVAAALEVADRLDAPCHLHLAEALYERDQILERYGTTPVRLLEAEGLLGPRLLTIHSVWLDDEELDLLARSGTGVVHCPGANAFLGDGIARVPEMLQRGIRVGLGPDGGCANNRQSVFDEMRQATLMAKARLTDGGALDASTSFRLGTKGGADLLGLDAGGIEAGRFADLVALDLDDLSLHPLKTLEHQIVSSMQPTAIARVMVGGEVVVERGRLLRFDAAEVRRLIEETTSSWVRPS
jgi:5-methylthioadenosine/S-adenosylhomocysteine deaminase